MSRAVAECFPVGEFIRDEMNARGWTVDDVAQRMSADESTHRVWHLTVNLLIHCGDDATELDQETADALARAFGTSSKLWLNLNAGYQAWRALHGKDTFR